MKDKSLRLPLFISLVLHLTAITFIPVGKQKKIIYISFPIELVSIPPIIEQAEEKKESEAIAVPEIVTKKKPQKKVEKPKEKRSSPPAESPPQVAKQPLSSLSVEAAKFPYMYYLNQIRKKIAENWIFSRETGNLRTVVYFRIKSEGSIEGPKLTDSSGDKIFDQICLRAVKLAEPFPPLPAGYEEQYLGVYFEFAFRE
ncbi:MAG: TonB family protein [Elusimicrobiota bacterium]|nr:TonB family protein [Elusimicrobiota bacterium]